MAIYSVNVSADSAVRVLRALLPDVSRVLRHTEEGGQLDKETIPASPRLGSMRGKIGSVC